MNERSQIQPRAIDLEETILGAIMLESKAYFLVSDVLFPDVFYKQSHQEIYRAIEKIAEDGGSIDILSVTQKLRKLGTLEIVGGALAISKLTNRVASTAAINEWAYHIFTYYASREIIRLGSEAQKMAYEGGDPQVISKYIESSLHSLRYDPGSIMRVKDILPKIVEGIENALHDKSTGTPTGFYELDKIMHGWNKSDLIYIAARPSMGKTAFVISSAIQIAKANIPVLIFSIEMSAEQLVARIISQETDLEYGYLMHKKMDEQMLFRFHNSIGKYEGLPIFIDDTAGLSVYDFRSRCKRMKEKENIQAVFIDYVQLMTTGHNSNKLMGNREREISIISALLKQTAKELDIPVIALAQLSREVEKRPNKRPLLSDLRESGSLEQDADSVIFIYRDEYYGNTEDENGNPTQGVAEIIIAKHRNGALGTPKLSYTDSVARFSDLGTHKMSIEYHPDSLIEPNKSFLEKPF